MKKWLYLSLIVVPLLVLGMLFPAFAQDQPPCTETPEYCQVKVAQVPFPWQFWATETQTVDGTTWTYLVDKIRISQTWRVNPPVGQPAGEDDVFVSRWVAVVPGLGMSIPLDELTWDFETDMPLGPELTKEYRLVWEEIDPLGKPALVQESDDLTLDINVNADDGAVLVAYPVMMDDAGSGPAVGHFINEAVLTPVSDPEPGDPVVEIVEVRVNFDIHNDTEFDVTNFELDFLGIDFTCHDVLWALGFVVGSDPLELWGANDGSPLVVHPIEVTLADGTVQKGTEVKWVQRDRPLKHCEWFHGGLSFTLEDLEDLIDGNVTETSVDVTVQGYWTIIDDKPPKVWCIESVNPHGNNVPGKNRSDNAKSKARNPDGFYQLFAEDICDPEPDIYVSCEVCADAFGPFASGTVIKFTEAKGAAPSCKEIGSSNGQAGAVMYHITLPSDPVIIAIDASGNISTCYCLVPPPPK